MTHPEDPTCQCGHPASQHALSIEANCRGADEDGCACRLYSEQVYAAEIARLQSVGQDYAAALNRKNAEVFRLHGERDALARDAARLDWLADEPIFDGLGKLDIHEVACDLAGGAEVSPDKMRDCYRKAIRVMIDAMISADAARSAAPSTTGEPKDV